MSDIKKFTGFLTSDGTAHNTQKAAVAYELELKTKKALAATFGHIRIGTVNDTHEEDSGLPMNEWLYANKDAIQAALQQEVLLRKARGPNKKKTDAAADAAKLGAAALASA
jgi:hypothetical protein